MPAWVVWAVVAVLLALGEIFTPGLFFLGPIALQLRYLQTLLEVSSGSTSTIIFPAPVDIIKPFLERVGKS